MFCDVSCMRSWFWIVCRAWSLVVWSSGLLFCCSLLRLWPCSCCGSENVVCNSLKTKAFCAEYSAEIYIACRARSLVVWLSGFPVRFFVCDPARAVALRILSITPRKRKHSVLSIQRKLEICDCARNGWTYSRISAEYGIVKSTVFDIVRVINIRLAKLQTYGIFRVMERVRSRRVRITDIPLYLQSVSNFYIVLTWLQTQTFIVKCLLTSLRWVQDSDSDAS